MTTLQEDARYRSQEMQDSMPNYYSESPEVIAIMDANATEIERKRAEAYDLQAQLFVSTATWGLTDWERVLALSPRPNSTLDFRRSRIIARLNGTAPATVAYLTDVVNAHVADKSARIVEVNGEYRFEAEINVDNSIDMSPIIRDINEVKPAHLAFGITGIIRVETINVRSKAYDFAVPYKKTNMFHTAGIPGVKAVIPFNLREKAYSFGVVYPIANMFTTSGLEARLNSELSLSVNTDVYFVPYIYVGDIELGAGTRLGGPVYDTVDSGSRVFVGATAEINVVDKVVADAPVQMATGTEDNEIIYRRMDSIVLGEVEL